MNRPAALLALAGISAVLCAAAGPVLALTALACVAGLWRMFSWIGAGTCTTERLTNPALERLRSRTPRAKAQRIAWVKAIAAEVQRIKAQEYAPR